MIDGTMLASPTGFAELGLDSRLLDCLTELGYTDPTPIQRQAIPPLLEGKDLIGLAATGTGKTAAFALPLLHGLANHEGKRPAVLILVPTRELCLQVASAMNKYGRPLRVRVVPVYGGADIAEQVRALRKGADVVVATPGRTMDHLRRGTLAFDGITAVVLDEADEMLDMGFADDLEAILAATPSSRQTALFSATMPPRIASIAAQHLTDPVRVTVFKPAAVSGETPQVRQAVYLVPPSHKLNALVRLLEFEAPTSALVFCRTRNETDAVADRLAAHGFRTESLHGGLSQEQRDRVMRNFRDGRTPLLIATDVAARGLDISHLSHVVNYGLPEGSEAFVHRIGRVGRAGREGVALTIAEPREQFALRSLERALGSLNYGRVPTGAELREKRRERLRESLRERMAAGDLNDWKAVVEPLLADHDPTQLALAALALAEASSPMRDLGPDIPPVRPPQPSAPRSPRPVAAPARSGRRMTWISLNVGRAAGLTRRDLIVAIENEVGLGSRDLGVIEVSDRFSHVEVPEEICDQVIETLDGMRFRGRAIVVRRS